MFVAGKYRVFRFNFYPGVIYNKHLIRTRAGIDRGQNFGRGQGRAEFGFSWPWPSSEKWPSLAEAEAKADFLDFISHPPKFENATNHF